MKEYTESEKKRDFDYFKEINIPFYEENGHKFVAIKNQKILDQSDNIIDLINSMSKKGYEVGTYLAQECNGVKSDYVNTVMRLVINA